MKEAMGGVSLFQIVVVFLLVFTGIMCLTINHSKAFGVKDEIINILETDTLPSYSSNNAYEISDETKTAIIDHLNEVGYRITGDCPKDEGWIGYTRNGDTTQNNAAFCIKANNVHDSFHKDLVDKCTRENCDPTYGDFPSMVYYDVALFYQLDIPLIKSLFNLKLYGSTKVLFG